MNTKLDRIADWFLYEISVPLIITSVVIAISEIVKVCKFKNVKIKKVAKNLKIASIISIVITGLVKIYEFIIKY